MLNEEKTILQKKVDETLPLIGDVLELGKEYKGKIKKIFYSTYSNGGYDFEKITISYEVNDDGLQKITSDDYTFGGDFDNWYLQQLLSFIKRLNGVYVGDIDFRTYQTVVNSLQFLVGADVTLYQYLTKKETVKNNVTVLGTFNRHGVDLETKLNVGVI